MKSSVTALPIEGSPEGALDDFEEIYRELYHPLMKFFADRGCELEDRKDLVQETFLRAYRSFDGFRGEAKRSTWIFTIATNLWINRRRDGAAAKRDGEEVPLNGLREGPVAEARSHERAVEAEKKRLLRSAIDELPPQMRRCVYLRVYQDRSHQQIADVLMIGVAGVKSQCSLARKKLRSKLAGRYRELETLLDDD